MMRARRLLWQLWPWRWWRAGSALLRGVRMNPSTVLIGTADQFECGRGSVIGANVRLDAGNAGRLIIGERVWLAADTEVETTTVVHIGTGTTIQRRSSINGNVRIGRGCILAPSVFISSGTHPFRAYPHLPIREQERLLANEPDGHRDLDRPVWIQDDCWLGVNAVICPGVTVGKGSVVGANAVVTRDVAPYSVVGGAPARVIGMRLEWRPPMRIDMEREEDLVYVLSGSTVRNDDGRPMAVDVSLVEPLLAIVSTTALQATLRYRASARMEVHLGSDRHILESGDAMIEFSLSAAARAQGGALIELALLPGSTDAKLRVLQITCI